MKRQGRNGTNPQIDVHRFASPAPSVDEQRPSGVASWLKRWESPIKTAAGIIAIVAAGVFAWSELRHGIEQRPTIEQTRALVEDEIAGELQNHTAAADPHPDMHEQLRELRETQTEMRDLVLELKPLVTAVDELKRELRRMRRR